LRLAYVGTKAEVSANLNRLSARAEIAKWVLTHEAQKRGWRCVASSRPWNLQEIAYLKENLDRISISRVAHDLRRSVVAAQAKAAEVKLLARVADEYTVSDLGECFGVRQARVESWMRRGLLGKAQVSGADLRYAAASVAQFIRRHAREYDLCRLNQTWFKAIVFGALSEEEGRG
jgi:hypothetical protein